MKTQTKILTLLLFLVAMAYHKHPVAAEPLDTPTVLVSDAVDFDIVEPKLFWQDLDCTPRPPARSEQEESAIVYDETINRIGTLGSQPRTLMLLSANAYCGEAGDQHITSNLVSDGNYLYYATSVGLMRLSVNANPGDVPQTLSTAVKGDLELVRLNNSIWILQRGPTVGSLWQLNTTTLSVTFALTINKSAYALSAVTSGTPTSRQITYVLWKEGSTLNRYNATDGGTDVIGLNVTYYMAEGNKFSCGITSCIWTSYVFIRTGTQIYRYNNNSTSPAIVIYTTAAADIRVQHLVADGTNLFFFENYIDPCGGFLCNYTNTLKRRGRSTTGTTDSLYVINNNGPLQLKESESYLFWRDESGAINRFAKNALTLPVINMRITEMRVVQSVYDQSRPVSLIQRKRTFVRVLVKSDGASIPNVQAYLTRTGDSDQLLPINAIGTRITVRNTPNNRDIDHAFLFELPWSWTTGNTTLTANINPYHTNIEPNYSDNVSQKSISFVASPKLSLELFRLAYDLNGTRYAPRSFEDVLATYSWIMRAYPLGGSIGDNFRPRTWIVEGSTQLGKWVENTSSECSKSEIGMSDRSLCASFYTNGWLNQYRALGWVPNATGFYYGMITDAAGIFPRGQAMYANTSVGPTGTGSWGWDFDGTYGDWYAGHEIGHSLGRAHPSKGNACGHSASDNSYPYTGALIGPGDGTAEGFDAGSSTFGIAKALYPDNVWVDMMSYCDNQWISAYTYNAIYSYMLLHPSRGAEETQAITTPGNWLSISGVINTTENIAAIADIRHLSDAVIPPLVAGAYQIRQRNASNTLLRQDAFTPVGDADETTLGFNQVVTLAAGARIVEIVRISDNAVLTSHSISANPPTLSNVALQSPPNPVSGVVTLGWTASDSNGDALTFDIFYSADGGATFGPVQMDVTGNSHAIDTSQLAGSANALFRVIAHDGFYTAQANTASFAMSNKAPQPFILDPADEIHIQYGQLINFNGGALDIQDQFVADSGLSWYNDGIGMGTGAQVSSDTLEVGPNIISLTAINSLGVSAEVSITVIVEDDLTAPTTLMTVSPTQVGWHVAANSTTVQTYDLTVTNAGFGTFDWTVTSDQTWLTIVTASGTVNETTPNAVVTVQGNPTGLNNDETALAQLTFTNTTTGQTVIVPVSLGKGQTWFPPTQSVPTAVELNSAEQSAFTRFIPFIALMMAGATVWVMRQKRA